jgi:hypothetical protein
MDETTAIVVYNHLPFYVTGPGESDILFTAVTISPIAIVVGFGALYFTIQAIPDRIAKGSSKTQMQLVGLLGLISLFRTVTILSDMPGRIAEVYLRNNQDVRAGDPIFRLDTRRQITEVEAALVLAETEIEKSTVYAGTDGNVQQFKLKPGDIVSPILRPAGILVPYSSGMGRFQAGFGQISAQVVKVGMITEITCASKPLTVIPMVVTEVQGAIAGGQLRPTDQLIDIQDRRRPGTIMAILEPIYEGHADTIPPGSVGAGVAYTSRATERETGALQYFGELALSANSDNILFPKIQGAIQLAPLLLGSLSPPRPSTRSHGSRENRRKGYISIAAASWRGISAGLARPECPAVRGLERCPPSIDVDHTADRSAAPAARRGTAISHPSAR